jgi:hypothetical protein
MEERTSWQDELIDNLVTDAQPVRRLWRPELRLLVWLAVFALVAVFVGGRFVRSDLESQLQSPLFLLEAAAMLVAGSLLGLEALRAAVPGHRHDRTVVRTIIATLAIVLLLLLRYPIHWGWTPDVFLKFGVLDLVGTALLVAVPWAWLLAALRRGAPLASGRAAALAGAAAFCLTFVVMRCCCQTDELMHLGVFHVLPVLIGTALSAGLGVLLLPRWRSSSAA